MNAAVGITKVVCHNASLARQVIYFTRRAGMKNTDLFTWLRIRSLIG